MGGFGLDGYTDPAAGPLDTGCVGEKLFLVFTVSTDVTVGRGAVEVTIGEVAVRVFWWRRFSVVAVGDHGVVWDWAGY